MTIRILISLFLSIPLAALSAPTLHETSLVIDGHNDLPWALREEGDVALTKFDLKQLQAGKFHTDIPRLKQGNVGAQFWSAYVPVSTMQTGTALKMTREQVDLVHRMVAKYPDVFELAASTADIRHARAAGKIASLIGIEGGHSIEDSLDSLRDLYKRGARYMTLSHSKNLAWIESATDTAMAVPLSAFGKDVVREMNRLGMLVDISHISARAMREVLAVAAAPVIASHSSAFALKAHPRNVPDDVLKTVTVNGGVIMVNFYSAYISDQTVAILPSAVPLRLHDCVEEDARVWSITGRLPKADVSGVVDHIEHIAKVAGIDHVGLGSDYDGVPLLPTGLEDVSKFPNVTTELKKRGYSDTDVRKILGENLMRVFAAVEAYAAAHP